MHKGPKSSAIRPNQPIRWANNASVAEQDRRDECLAAVGKHKRFHDQHDISRRHSTDYSDGVSWFDWNAGLLRSGMISRQADVRGAENAKYKKNTGTANSRTRKIVITVSSN